MRSKHRWAGRALRGLGGPARNEAMLKDGHGAIEVVSGVVRRAPRAGAPFHNLTHQIFCVCVVGLTIVGNHLRHLRHLRFHRHNNRGRVLSSFHHLRHLRHLRHFPHRHRRHGNGMAERMRVVLKDRRRGRHSRLVACPLSLLLSRKYSVEFVQMRHARRPWDCARPVWQSHRVCPAIREIQRLSRRFCGAVCRTWCNS